MATEKQVDWALKLAQWNKKDLTRKDVESLSDEQLDELFANLKKVTVKRVETSTPQQQVKQPAFNGQRFGLACKLVLEGVNFDFVFHNKDQYIKQILQYYWIMTEAEQAGKDLLIVGDVDADQLLDEQRDKELIAQRVM